MTWVMLVLKVRIAEILSRTPARSVALVFEASQRADPLLSEFLGALELEEDGRKIAVEHRLMAKSGGEPALEVPTSLCTLSEGWPVGDWKESRAPQLILTPCSDVVIPGLRVASTQSGRPIDALPCIMDAWVLAAIGVGQDRLCTKSREKHEAFVDDDLAAGGSGRSQRVCGK